MTRPAPPARLVADLPAEQAEVLANIHDLARRASAIRREQRHSPELARLDFDRSIAEITAAALGVPAVWINQARELGTKNRAWQPTTVLRDPPKDNVVRRGFGRVVADTDRIADMAAVTVVREHHLQHAGIDGEPEPAVAHQLWRNMEALRTRVIYTADAINMDSARRARSWTVTDANLANRVHAHSHLAVDDLTALWRDLGTPAIAASVRSSLASLRRTTTASVELDMEPATTQDLLTRAREQLAVDPAPGSERGQGQVIDAAVQAALPVAAFEPDSSQEQVVNRAGSGPQQHH
ncbi:hypothetical protein, partial [Nocardia sp. NPDC058497]|uniref:hypothetical protein n=1 Tax=Nocardia sp. NPDC058497 TaxID=3346529 RepID=UPI003657E946